jgi:hypothetical protein
LEETLFGWFDFFESFLTNFKNIFFTRFHNVTDKVCPSMWLCQHKIEKQKNAIYTSFILKIPIQNINIPVYSVTLEYTVSLTQYQHFTYLDFLTTVWRLSYP